MSVTQDSDIPNFGLQLVQGSRMAFVLVKKEASFKFVGQLKIAAFTGRNYILHNKSHLYCTTQDSLMSYHLQGVIFSV